jgi:hypothetical protein
METVHLKATGCDFYPEILFGTGIVTFSNGCYPSIMPTLPELDKLKERTLLLLLLTLLLFASPLTIAWAWGGAPWILPYLLWLLLIGIGAWLHYRYGRHDL